MLKIYSKIEIIKIFNIIIHKLIQNNRNLILMCGLNYSFNL